jgi:flagellar biosynthesis protein FliP
MNGPDFLLIIDLFVSLLNTVFDIMRSVVIVSTSPPLTLYGLAVFIVFYCLVADFVSSIRSGN